METIPILYGLSQRPKVDYPTYIQQFIPELDMDGKLVTPEDHEHMIHGALLYDLILYYQAQTVVEIGTRSGKSSRIIVEALRVTKGHLTSIDMENCSCENVSEEDKQTYITFYKSVDINLSWNLPINILFVDHSHRYGATRRTLDKFWPYVTTPGAMLFADGDSHFEQGQACRDFAERNHIGYIEDTRAQGYALFFKPLFPHQYRGEPETRHLIKLPTWNNGRVKVKEWDEQSYS